MYTSKKDTEEIMGKHDTNVWYMYMDMCKRGIKEPLWKPKFTDISSI